MQAVGKIRRTATRLFWRTEHGGSSARMQPEIVQLPQEIENRQPMYTSIRRYKTDSAAEVTKRVNEQFVPLIKGIPGLVAYYLVNTDHGTMTSVSVFETQEGQEESNRVAASWVKEGLSELLGPVEISAGEVTAYV